MDFGAGGELSMDRAHPMKWVKLALIAFGVWILWSMVRSVGIEHLARNISEIGWWLTPLLFIYPVIFAFDTMGWASAFPTVLPKNVSFRSLYQIRIIGETLNCVIPFSASLGGEPVKAELLKRRHGIPLADGLASILIVHTTFWLSLNLFVVGGIGLTFKSLPLTPVLWKSVLAFMIGLGSIALSLVAGLHFGVFQKIHKFGDRMKWWGGLSSEKLTRFLQLDRQIRQFYTENRRRFFLSTIWNFLGWVTGTIEVWYTARLVGMSVGWGEAWLLEALIQVLRIITFFIPSSIGAQEGGIVLIFKEFGFVTEQALTFALIRRLRELVWIGIGLFLWSIADDKPKISGDRQSASVSGQS